jgi:tetratricopeptide (TPR) repeat protein
MSVDRTALVGRERHLAELSRLVDGVKVGRGNLVVLSGEAGAGKTRLAEEAAALATDAGIEVAWATGWGDAAAPLSTWSDLVAVVDPKRLPDTSRVLRASEVDPEAARSVFVRSLVAQLREAAGSRPVLLVVDDVQWCDPLSLHAIERLVASIRSWPVGVLVTLREDGTPALARFAALTRVGRHLVVPPLTEAELGMLAMTLTGKQLPAAAIARLHDRSAGNALFARELLLARTSPESIDGPGPLSGARSNAVSMFADRLSAVSPECHDRLQVASVIGRRFRLDVLAETLGTSTESTLALLGEAYTARLVHESGIGAWEFAHPLIAEACYDGAGLPRRIRLHRDVGEALERLRSRGIAISSAELAHHFANAAAAGVPEKAVQYAAAAGRETMETLGYEDAAKEYMRALAALELCPADDEARADLLLELGDAHAAAGDLPSARAAYEAVARLAREHGWPERLARAALGVGSGPGGFEVPAFDREQISLLEEVASVAEGSQRAHVLARLSVALSLVDDGPRRVRLSEDAVAAARDANDALALGYALASWCDVFAGPADVKRRLDATAEILACAATARDTRLELLGRRLRVVALLEAGAIADVDDEIAAFASLADRLGQVVYSWYVPLWRAMRAVMDGRLEDADRLRRDAGRLGEAAHSENAAMLTGSQHAMLRCEIGDPAAVAFFEDVMVRWPGLAIMARPGLAYVYAVTGEVARADEVLAAVNVADYSIETLGSEWLPSVVMLAYAAALTRNRGVASQLYETLAPFRELHAIDGIGCYDMGSVERALAMLAALRGDTTLATDHFDAALRRHRQIGARLLVAGTLRDAGRALNDAELTDAAETQYAALGLSQGSGEAHEATANGGAANVFRRDGEVWVVGLNGSTTTMRDTKGMRDLAKLLTQPGTEVHVLDLVAYGPTVRSDAAGDPIDDSARRQYQARLLEIEGDLAEADERADVARSERLHVERDALLAELSGAYGLGGRARRRGDSTERARSAVTQRIRDAISRIEAADAGLGGHLRRSIRTGTFCSYSPEQPPVWET